MLSKEKVIQQKRLFYYDSIWTKFKFRKKKTTTNVLGVRPMVTYERRMARRTDEGCSKLNDVCKKDAFTSQMWSGPCLRKNISKTESLAALELYADQAGV